MQLLTYRQWSWLSKKENRATAGKPETNKIDGETLEEAAGRTESV